MNLFDPSKELNPFVAKYKTTRKGKWGFRTKQQIEDTMELSLMLLALGRDKEALQVAAFLHGHVSFVGDYRMWLVYCGPCSVAFRVAPALGEPDPERFLAQFRETPAFRYDEAFIDVTIKEQKRFLSLAESKGNAYRRSTSVDVLCSTSKLLANAEFDPGKVTAIQVRELLALHASALKMLRASLE